MSGCGGDRRRRRQAPTAWLAIVALMIGALFPTALTAATGPDRPALAFCGHSDGGSPPGKAPLAPGCPCPLCCCCAIGLSLAPPAPPRLAMPARLVEAPAPIPPPLPAAPPCPRGSAQPRAPPIGV